MFVKGIEIAIYGTEWKMKVFQLNFQRLVDVESLVEEHHHVLTFNLKHSRDETVCFKVTELVVIVLFKKQTPLVSPTH